MAFENTVLKTDLEKTSAFRRFTGIVRKWTGIGSRPAAIVPAEIHAPSVHVRTDILPDMLQRSSYSAIGVPAEDVAGVLKYMACLLYTSPSPRD